MRGGRCFQGSHHGCFFRLLFFIKLKKEINKLKRKRKTMANTEVNTR
ncbi:hypothetical protein GTCCBUS3UF5_7890 [Geobacillus thermoleovorans CCB_US3_UF5]|uniref:Uncharacterized protein n=1 Tax=Geobacillus thermoleovorans CCB_US3_UF5 TaxID=1111068 RepID=A0ABN3ZRI5_GEOTH|nr:hypothetical protein GTCCBUS3UF5_7890 [Geobacillus thermoleovorans CCB_US3_UF5]GAJ59993.1 hypothetical protein B23_3219 [Geobacillus thermoleovorans B23]